MADSALSASAKGASFLILLQIGSRALTFALNQILLRFLSPATLGVAVQLELYCISVLYFSRESLRVALQRRADGIQAVVNIAWLAVVAGLPLSYFLAELYMRTELPQIPYLLLALRAYGVAAVVELLAEPGFVAAQQSMMYKVRASAEATATIVKTIATVGLAVWANRQGNDLGVLPFAAGQLAYATSLLFVYTLQMSYKARSDGFSLFPKRVVSAKPDQYLSALFYKPLLTLASSVFVQSSIKYVLTQGDSLLIASLASLQDQGAYALSSNYGGLIARMLFQPIEDASRNLFAKLCNPVAETKDTSKDQKTPTQSKTSAGDISQANKTLTDILKFYNLISLVAFSFGPTLAPLLLQIVAGSRWTATGASDVLGTYCYYIPLLAINGVTEAFVAASANNADLYIQSLWMGGFFVGFAGSAYVFLRVLEFGAQGLVWANCVNMTLRILFNLNFVTTFFRRNGQSFDILATLPSGYSIALTSSVPVLLGYTKGVFNSYGIFGELIRIGAIAGVFVIGVAVAERRFITHCYRLIRPSPK